MQDRRDPHRLHLKPRMLFELLQGVLWRQHHPPEADPGHRVALHDGLGELVKQQV
jgi:hypothetical protein